MELIVSIKIDRPREQVWKAITDVGNFVNMIDGIISLKILHKPKDDLVGLKWEETRKMFGKESSETMWITDYKDNQYYCTRAENCGAVYSTKMAVSEEGKNSLLTMSFTSTSESVFVKFVSSIMSIFIKKSMIKMLEKDLSDIKAFVEKS